MDNKFERPEMEGKPPILCKLIGVRTGSPKREVVFESLDYDEFMKAYRYHYGEGKFTMLLKEFEDYTGEK